MTKFEVIVYWSGEDKAFIAEVPELPGCAADGKTLREALGTIEARRRRWPFRPLPQQNDNLRVVSFWDAPLLNAITCSEAGVLTSMNDHIKRGNEALKRGAYRTAKAEYTDAALDSDSTVRRIAEDRVKLHRARFWTCPQK